jgi:hypothetical protein
MRLKIIVVLLFALLLPTGLIFAQNVDLEWTRWDAQINVGANDQMQIAETQEINVLGGQLNFGSRFWTQRVDVQSVFIKMENDSPVQLTQSNNGQPGTYSITTENGGTVVTYYPEQPLREGDSFIVQINYTATSPTTGMVDWNVVPADNSFPVRSSTVQINFPQGEAPDSSLARVSEGNGTVQVNGNVVTIQSQGTIAPGQRFAIQIPYGAGVGAAGGNNNPVNPQPGNNPVNPNPGTNTPVLELPSGTMLLVLSCLCAFVFLFGGSSLLRNLLGGLFGGILGGNRTSGGGIFGGGSRTPGGSIFGSGRSNDSGNSTAGRGFRRSSDQNRDVGNVGNDKDSGGGTRFG